MKFKIIRVRPGIRYEAEYRDSEAGARKLAQKRIAEPREHLGADVVVVQRRGEESPIPRIFSHQTQYQWHDVAKYQRE